MPPVAITPSSERPPVRAVTFDVTGTLIRSPRIGEIYAEVLARHGLEASSKEVRRLIPTVFSEMACRTDGSRDRFSTHPDGPRGWWRRFAERLAEYLELPAPSRFATAELYDRFARADAWEIYPDTLECLDALAPRVERGELVLGVVANWDERLPRLLDELELAGRFQAIVHASGVGYEKPDGRIFAAALDALQVAPAETVHVGDRHKEDVEGAVAAGLRAVHLVRRRPGDRRTAPPPSEDAIDSLVHLPFLLAP